MQARKEEKCGGAASTSAKQAAKALLKKTAAKEEAVAMPPVSPAAAAPLVGIGRGREESSRQSAGGWLAWLGWAFVRGPRHKHSRDWSRE
jgi:hypothetical protein